MTLYRCPSCRGPAIRLKGRLWGTPRCPTCSQRMLRWHRGGHGPALAVGVAAIGLLVAALPDLVDGLASVAITSNALPRLIERLEPDLAPHEQPASLLEGSLFQRLAAADRQWIPTVEQLPDGSKRYLYKRRLGEPELSIEQIRHRMRHPPRHDEERLAIQELLGTLQAADIRLVMTSPKKPGAAGEWDHAFRTLRIDPEVVEKGTMEFAKVLNHEAIHVAQSCAAGSVRARPRVLGLGTRLDPEQERHLNDPIYSTASPEELALEREAYANQHLLGTGATLIRSHCRLKG